MSRKNDDSSDTPASQPIEKPKGRPRAIGKDGVWREVNRVQLAALMGVHPDTVTDYVRNGMPVQTAGGRGKESVYDSVACLDWWRQGQGKNATEAAKTRALSASADLNELKLQRELGELLPRDLVVREGRAFVKAWRALVLALPRQFRQTGIISTDDQESHARAACKQLLVSVSSWKTSADAERASTDAAA